MTRTREENAADLAQEAAAKTYAISVIVTVNDEKALLAAGRERAIKDGLDPEQAEELGVEDVLRWFIDPGKSPPGTVIQDSTAERL